MRLKVAIVDIGYHGYKTNIGGTEILFPKPPKRRTSEYEKKRQNTDLEEEQ